MGLYPVGFYPGGFSPRALIEGTVLTYLYLFHFAYAG